MNPKTEQLLASLEVITEGLWYSSETDYPILPFVWEFAEMGEFNLLNFLISRNLLQMADREDFCQAWRRAQKSGKQPSLPQDLSTSATDRQQESIGSIEELRSHLTDLEFYHLGSNCLATAIIVGKIPNDAWVCLSGLRSEICTPIFGQILTFEDGYSTPKSELLRGKIQPFVKDMQLLTSIKLRQEQEINWQVAESKDRVLIKLLNSCQYVQTYKSFSLSYDRLNRFMVSELKQLQTYVTGTSIYAVGETPSGDWIGVGTGGYWS